MPDFERPLRSLELHLARTAEERAFVRGKLAGEDKARWQAVAIFFAVNMLAIAAAICLAHANL